MAREAIRGEKTLSQLGSPFKIHPSQIAKGKTLGKCRIGVTPEQPGPGRPDSVRDIYHGRVLRRPKTKFRTLAWILCAMMSCLAIHTPHCGLCDGVWVDGSLARFATAAHPVPNTHDECNGI